MTIEEMHVTFRELAQQMGMQTVRAILTEDIDICLNAAIIAKVRSTIIQNVGTNFSDKVAKENANISPINSLRTLYYEKDINLENINGDGTELNPYNVIISTNDIMIFTGFYISYDNKLYNCRIIENEKLGETLHDYCNRASKKYPIVSIISDIDNIIVKIYTNSDKPKVVRYLYIKMPNKVFFNEEDPTNNINCDLPEYTHMEIVENAINYYIQSIGTSIKKDND